MKTSTVTPQITADLVGCALKAKDGIFAKMPSTEVEKILDNYSKFIELAMLRPDRRLAPSEEIDAMWHLHMLHPISYYNDCIANFGEIMDHDGGFGADSHEEMAELTVTFKQTSELWKQHFGEQYPGKMCTCFK
jgi:hypothetical protein